MNLESLPQNHFRVIYADPPWPGQSGFRDLHYQSMTKKDILNMPVQKIAMNDCLLALWSTWLHLPMAVQCIESWGFTYCTGMPWLKTTKDGQPIFGLGIWFRGCSELLLIAKRGRIPNPRPARKGLIQSVRGPHSEKPMEARSWLTNNFCGPRIELFARDFHKGWTSWGNQLPNRDKP